MTPERSEPGPREGDHGAPRKPYHAPRLTVHGRIEDITAALGFTNSDGVIGSRL